MGTYQATPGHPGPRQPSEHGASSSSPLYAPPHYHNSSQPLLHVAPVDTSNQELLPASMTPWGALKPVSRGRARRGSQSAEPLHALNPQQLQAGGMGEAGAFLSPMQLLLSPEQVQQLQQQVPNVAAQLAAIAQQAAMLKAKREELAAAEAAFAREQEMFMRQAQAQALGSTGAAGMGVGMPGGGQGAEQGSGAYGPGSASSVGAMAVHGLVTTAASIASPGPASSALPGLQQRATSGSMGVMAGAGGPGGLGMPVLQAQRSQRMLSSGSDSQSHGQGSSTMHWSQVLNHVLEASASQTGTAAGSSHNGSAWPLAHQAPRNRGSGQHGPSYVMSSEQYMVGAPMGAHAGYTSGHASGTPSGRGRAGGGGSGAHGPHYSGAPSHMGMPNSPHASGLHSLPSEHQSLASRISQMGYGQSQGQVPRLTSLPSNGTVGARSPPSSMHTGVSGHPGINSTGFLDGSGAHGPSAGIYAGGQQGQGQVQSQGQLGRQASATWQQLHGLPQSHSNSHGQGQLGGQEATASPSGRLTSMMLPTHHSAPPGQPAPQAFMTRPGPSRHASGTAASGGPEALSRQGQPGEGPHGVLAAAWAGLLRQAHAYGTASDCCVVLCCPSWTSCPEGAHPRLLPCSRMHMPPCATFLHRCYRAQQGPVQHCH